MLPTASLREAGYYRCIGYLQQTIGCYFPPDPAARNPNCVLFVAMRQHVALLKGAERLSNETVGNVFVADSNHGAVQSMLVDVDWSPRGAIAVTYPANARVYKKVQRVADFCVSYLQQ
jgi:hypothetical protein